MLLWWGGVEGRGQPPATHDFQSRARRRYKRRAFMRYARTFLAFALAACVTPAMAERNNDDAKIRKLEDRFSAAFNAKDVDAIMSAYVSDESLFVFDVAPPRQYVGARAYRKDWEDFLRLFKGPLKMELSDLDVSTDGVIGYGHSIQHVSGTDTKGKPIVFAVRVSDVYRKIDGKWLIVQEHVSVPVNFDTGKPDIMSTP
jgi:ketosteroid isomerase-like protein